MVQFVACHAGPAVDGNAAAGVDTMNASIVLQRKAAAFGSEIQLYPFDGVLVGLHAPTSPGHGALQRQFEAISFDNVEKTADELCIDAARSRRSSRQGVVYVDLHSMQCTTSGLERFFLPS